jgi:hypothetical protein
LNNYNPKEFFDKLNNVFKDILVVKELIREAPEVQTTKGEVGWEKKVQGFISSKKAPADSAFFIAISSDLRLPALNLGKFLFKNPPRSSKLTFTFHIYDGTGREVIGDTIINRGCLINTLDEKKGNRFFYSDYKSFIDDMECHLAVIKKILQEKQLAVKPKKYNET